MAPGRAAIRLSLIFAGALAAVSLLWLFAGRWISMQIDRVGTLRMLAYPAAAPSFEDHDRAVNIGGKRFDLGELPKPEDTLALTIDRSLLSWPTPFEINFMTGHSPRWKRHRYYRILWTKSTGQRVEMVWRYEQWFYPAFGWTESDATRENATGLIRVRPL